MTDPSRTGPKNRTLIGLVYRATGWALIASILILSLSPAESRPETPLPHNLEHFGIFALTGLAFGLGYKHKLLRLAIFLSIFAATVELAQTLTPDRHARLTDLVVDIGAMCGGVLVAAILIPRPA